jgi:cytochrome d ubiquinol oxidase subunit II
VLGGVLAVVVCAFLAAVYLAADADHQDNEVLATYFRSRAIASGVVAGVVAAVGIAVLHSDSRRLFAHLTGRAFPILVASAVAGIATLVLLLRGRYAVARITAAAAVVTVVWGWAAGQYPYLINGRLTISQAAGARATLQALLAAVGAGIVVIGPALVWLLLLARRGDLRQSEQVSGQPRNAG